MDVPGDADSQTEKEIHSFILALYKIYQIAPVKKSLFRKLQLLTKSGNAEIF
jgi:hypothetical protein